MDQSLHVGDIIEVDGRVGEVQEIKLRTTVMFTRNDRVMVIPNHKFMDDTLLIGHKIIRAIERKFQLE